MQAQTNILVTKLLVSEKTWEKTDISMYGWDTELVLKTSVFRYYYIQRQSVEDGVTAGRWGTCRHQEGHLQLPGGHTQLPGGHIQLPGGHTQWPGGAPAVTRRSTCSYQQGHLHLLGGSTWMFNVLPKLHNRASTYNSWYISTHLAFNQSQLKGNSRHLTH
jgi:hypothetical protein